MRHLPHTKSSKRSKQMTKTRKIDLAPAMAAIWGISEPAARIRETMLETTDSFRETDADGNEWAQIYLDNAIPTGMSRRSFAGYLRALQRAGLYKTQGDDCFGMVRI